MAVIDLLAEHLSDKLGAPVNIERRRVRQGRVDYWVHVQDKLWPVSSWCLGSDRNTAGTALAMLADVLAFDRAEREEQK